MQTEIKLRLCTDVAVAVPVPEPFTYAVPPESEAMIKPGMRVRIPFKNRETIGYAVRVESREISRPLKEILGVLDAEPVLTSHLLKLTHQISRYYGSSWGEAIENALPKWVKFGKRAEKALAAMDAASGVYSALEPSSFLLTGEQRAAMDCIEKSLGETRPRPILLHGVTGSGKSELYIRAIRRCLAAGRGAVCLVPEITLTEQLKRFFARQFGEELEILHSKLSDGERFLSWKRLQSGKTRIVLGPRSAVFAPVDPLGLIIIDEEQEGSYKQETTPRYHAREVALWRAANENALLILGSATPSLEAAEAAKRDHFRSLVLSKRIDDRKMPEVGIIDLREHRSSKKGPVILSRNLAREIETNLKKREGTLLLLNRRGFSTHIHCPACGHIEECVACHVSLTFHQEEDVLLCHYCNFRKKAAEECSNCRMPVLRFAGFGTERVESEVARWFPQARIARLDADSVRRKGSHEQILEKFRSQEIDILIGTQMIAKGFDFPHVTLVGVILADVGLMLPDFRSAERTFQLMTQVAGRAGRGAKAGRVLIQTYSPKHPSIVFARNHDYGSFYLRERAEREKHRYPPFYRLINFIIRSKDEEKAYLAARSFRDALTASISPEEGRAAGLEIIGPAPLPFYKLRGHYRWHVMLKLPHESGLLGKIHSVAMQYKKPSAVQMATDVDPLNIL